MRRMGNGRGFKIRGLAVFLCLMFLPVSVWAADYYVAVGGDNANDGSAGTPWKSITHALGQAVAGDIIHVAGGTYSVLATGESFPLVMKQEVTVSGANRDTTILDGASAAAVISAVGVNTVTLSNFTISNGKASQGGGINIADSNINITNNIIRNNEAASGAAISAKGFSGTISGNTITANLATDTGGGIRLTDSSGSVSGNVVSNNQAGAGAGFYLTGGTSAITANQITSNTAYMHGGGLYIADCAGSVERNTILSNQATTGSGGGIYAVNFSGSLNNNLIAKNVADAVGGLYASGFDSTSELINNTIADNVGTLAESVGGMQAAGVSSVLKNNIFWNNGADDLYGGLEGAGILNEGAVGISYSLIDDYVGTNNNIYADPAFANAVGSDYSLTAGSPAIDTGTANGAPALDIEGNSRSQGAGVDMGAYESVGFSTPVCGNGVIEPPEECDDGNTADGDGCSSICEIEAATFCEIKTDYTPGVACAQSTVVVNNDAELDAYLVDFGFNGSKYQNLKIKYNVSRSTIDIHSPCKIKLKNNVVLTGDTICLDGRKEVNGFMANADQVTVLSELGHAGFGQGSVINAGELTIRAMRIAKIGKNYQVNVSGAVSVVSTGNVSSSEAIIKTGSTVNAASLLVEALKWATIGLSVDVNVSGAVSVISTNEDAIIKRGAQVDADSLLVEASKEAAIGGAAQIAITGNMSLISTGSVGSSEVVIKRGATVSADNLNMASGKWTTLKNNVVVTTIGNFHMEAVSPEKCSIAGSATINAGSTSGNCLE